MAELYDSEEFIEEDDGMPAEDVQAAVQIAIEDAVDFIDNTISPIRAESAEYYNGEPLGNEEDGRSTAQTLDVRDTVQAMLPSLMRIFAGSDHVVEYAPYSPEDIDSAKQATDYVNYILRADQDQGFIELMYECMKDALVKGSGFLKYYYDESENIQTYDLDNLDDQALAALNSDPDIEVDMLQTVVTDEAPQPVHSVRVTHRRKTGKVKVDCVPPEEIIVDRRARSIENADLVAHRAYLTISDLVSMGYDYDEMEGFATNETDFELFNEEARERLENFQDDRKSDATQQRVLYVEAYMQLDMDGDGVSELRRICCAGPSYEVIKNDPADQIPFAFFCPDPEPHSFFGTSIADLTKDIQRIKSAVLRASLDSLAMSTHPRVGIVEGQASLEDVMNNEAGGVIRMRNPGAVVPFVLPYVGQQAFPMLQYMDEVRENRTGISKAADGLDPSALQSSTLMAVQQTVAAAQQRTELIARLFAEGGMTRLYRGLLQLIIKHQDKPRMIRLRNQFVAMQPDRWNADMDVVTNIHLGKGSDAERMSLLQQVAQKQEQILQLLGPENPLVNVQNYYATLTQILETAGFKDTNRFFTDPSQAQQQPQEDPKPDPNEQMIQLQMQAIQADMQKKQADLALEREKMMREDDRRRDKDEADIALKAAEITARYGAQVDMASIKANADRDRELVKQLAGTVNGSNA